MQGLIRISTTLLFNIAMLSSIVSYTVLINMASGHPRTYISVSSHRCNMCEVLQFGEKINLFYLSENDS